MTKALYESDHPYWPSTVAYVGDRAVDGKQESRASVGLSDYGFCTTIKWTSLEKFLSEFHNADVDYNLVVRWDWYSQEDGIDEAPYVVIHMFHQRKGYLTIHTIESVFCTEENDRALRKYLKPHYEQMLENWKPFGEESGDGTEK